MDAMDPTGMLVREHELIERVVTDMKRKADSIVGGERPVAHYALAVADFFANYGDACHHGKEERILFAQLEGRDLAPEDAKLMQALIREHEWARNTIEKLNDSGDRFAHGDAGVLGEMAKELKALAQFYPQHAKKEEERFFPAARMCFSADEWNEMVGDFNDFDRRLIHQKYESLVSELEAGRLDEAVGVPG